MSWSEPHYHLGSIWYHSQPLEVPYSPNQFLGWDFFCSFLQQTGSRHPVTPATNKNTLKLAISGVPYLRILNMMFGIAFTCLLVTRQLTFLHCKCNMSIASHIHELQKVQALSLNMSKLGNNENCYNCCNLLSHKDS